MDKKSRPKPRDIPKRPESNTRKYSFTIPENVYDDFKAACEKEKASMSYVITTWIKEFLAAGEG